MSAWNPIDGWVSSKPSKMEVLARVGPITIDDYLIVSDSVSNNIQIANMNFSICLNAIRYLMYT